jgi:UDP-N-acetylglucosamine 2-epimerase (non-hydrolysing)
MILVVFGTTGEVIKLAPVLKRFDDLGTPYEILCTAQHRAAIPPMLQQFGLRSPDHWLAEGFRGGDLETARQVPPWAFRVAVRFLKRYSALRRSTRSSERRLVLVQGDTFTTVIGAGLGRVLRQPVAHIEAGVRSFDWRNPFPEELNRRATSFLAKIHFAPGPVAVRNLSKYSGTKVDTVTNTVKDALAMVPEITPMIGRQLPKLFGLVSLHRYELIKDERALTSIMERLAKFAKQTPLLFVGHPITVAKLNEFSLERLFDEEDFIKIQKVPYFEFVNLARAASFAITDSGGLQQESYYLNLPCLVHRERVETFEGIDENVIVSRMDMDVVNQFLEDTSRYRRKDDSVDSISPSEIILNFLKDNGFVE